MREIKYEARIKKDGAFFEVGIINFATWEVVAPDGEWYEIETLREFTGLHDKDGKEIYEGDIVMINHPEDMTGDFTNAIGTVFWWKSEAAFFHGNNSGRPPKRMWKHVKVIGNIHQNPELLEVQS